MYDLKLYIFVAVNDISENIRERNRAPMKTDKQISIYSIVQEKAATSNLCEKFFQLNALNWAILEIMNQLYHMGDFRNTAQRITNIIGNMRYTYAVDSTYNNLSWDKMYFWIKYPEVVDEVGVIEKSLNKMSRMNLTWNLSRNILQEFLFTKKWALLSDGILLHNYRKELDGQYKNFSKNLIAYTDLPLYEEKIIENKKESI